MSHQKDSASLSSNNSPLTIVLEHMVLQENDNRHFNTSEYIFTESNSVTCFQSRLLETRASAALVPILLQITTHVSINLELQCYDLPLLEKNKTKQECVCETLSKIRVQIYFGERVRNVCAYLELLNLKAHQSRLSADFVSISLQFRGGE